MVPLGLYAGQLTLNWAWPPIFFGARQMGVVSASLAPGDGPWRVGLLRGHGHHTQVGPGPEGRSRPSAASGPAPSCGASTAAFPPAREPDELLALVQGQRVGQPTVHLALCTPHVAWVGQRQLLPFYIWGN